MGPDPSSTSRHLILSRIRTALHTSSASPDPEPAWAAIPRTFRRSSDAPASALLERLADRLKDYDAQVTQATAEDLAQAIAQRLTARQADRRADRFILPTGFPESLLPQGFTYVRDEALSPAQLDECAGVITTCTLAIAETGTIVLQNAPGQGRRAASLVPDYHLCLLDARKVVATVPEAIAALHPTRTLPTTFISGPSATADIEMTRIKGVHGPRFLDVIVIAGCTQFP